MKKYLIKFKNQEKDCVESLIIEGMDLSAAISFAGLKYNISHYDIFHVEELPPENKATSENNNTIPPFGILAPHQIKEMEKKEKAMDFFDDVNWDDYTESLAYMTIPENWSNDTYPNTGILINYLAHTVEKLKSEKKIVETKDYELFNTGLFTGYYEPIYAYTVNPKSVSFLTKYDLGDMGIQEYPVRTNYSSDPSLLVFNPLCKINVDYGSVFEQQLPKEILERNDIINTLNGSINIMKKRVYANYNLAIPQYYNGEIQLLLPLCLRSDDKPDLALVVTKVGNTYQGHTCISLDTAYNNARLIAKLDNTWLNP